MSEYKLKTGKLGKEAAEAFKKVEEKFTDKFLEQDEGSKSGYRLKTGKAGETITGAMKEIENAVVSGYKKIEDGVVKGYKNIENKFVDAFLEKEEENREKNTEGPKEKDSSI